MRSIIIAIIVLLVIAAVAFFVGSRVFFKTTDSNFTDLESNAREALATTSEEPYLFLLEADLSFDNKATNVPDAHAYMVVSLDDANQTVSFLTIPARLQVTASDDETILLEEAKEKGGDAETILAVSNLLGKELDHFVSTNAGGLERLVDAIGGLTMEIPTQIDDPNAGILVIDAGTQLLDGEKALVYLRNTNHAHGIQQTAQNRVDFTFALLEKALDTQGFDFANIISEASQYVSTDMATNYLMDLADASRPLSNMTVYSSVIPSTETTIDGKTIYTLNRSEWEAAKASFLTGVDTDAVKDITIPNSEVSVEVRNGTNITGAAARLASILEGYGYPIGGVGNTNDGTIYPETLVIYTDPLYKMAAETIVSEISSGRIVNGGDYYSSDSDIIVIIGSDWSSIT